MYAFMALLARLPWSFLYILSDILALLIYHVIRYRRKVVRENLTNAFPHKSKEEIVAIEQKFYQHFADYIVETIKLLHVSDQEMQQRLVIENLEELRELIDSGESGYLLLGHYANWEWVTSLTMGVHSSAIIAQVYRPLKNKVMDMLFLKIRGRFNSVGVAKNDTYRTLVRWRKEQKQFLIGVMADQTPSAQNIHYWTHFLHQQTPVFTGIERIAKKLGGYVVYLDITKTGRGMYKGRFTVITTKPEETSPNYITETYIRLFEKTILREPAYWLWTHKRWKYKPSSEAGQH